MPGTYAVKVVGVVSLPSFDLFSPSTSFSPRAPARGTGKIGIDLFCCGETHGKGCKLAILVGESYADMSLNGC